MAGELNPPVCEDVEARRETNTRFELVARGVHRRVQCRRPLLPTAHDRARTA